MIFQGEYRHTLDEKGRISLPSKMRSQNESEKRWVVTKGLDRTLMIYPAQTWLTIVETKIATLNAMIADNRIFIRTFISPAVDCEEDKTGRLLIPANLLRYAEIAKDAVFLGAIHRIELFSIENFEAFENDPEAYIEAKHSAFERIAEKMTDIGL